MSSISCFSIKIDYDYDAQQPERVFHAMADLIEGINEVHGAVFDSIGSGFTLNSKLSKTREGSLISEQTQEVECTGFSKFMISIYKVTLDFLGKPTKINNLSDFDNLKKRYQDVIIANDEIMPKETLFMSEIDQYRMAKGLEKADKSRQCLGEKDNIKFGFITGCDPDNTFDRNFSIVGKVDDIFTPVKKEYEHINQILQIKKPAFGDGKWEFCWCTKLAGKKDFSASILDKKWLKRWHNREIPLLPGDGLKVDLVIKFSKPNKREVEIMSVVTEIEKEILDQLVIEF